jgi:hypothetical protein
MDLLRRGTTGPSCHVGKKATDEATGQNSPSPIWAMITPAVRPNETIGDIFLAVVTARKGLSGTIFAEKQASVVLVVFVCGQWEMVRNKHYKRRGQVTPHFLYATNDVQLLARFGF